MFYVYDRSTNIVSSSSMNSSGYILAIREGNLVLAADTETMQSCLLACSTYVNMVQEQ